MFDCMLLGAYRPRLLLITTPSYDFNGRFLPPNAPKSARTGFLDPTGRTDRVFRHHDHKFEWTVREFTEWCHRVAERWGYDVEIGGVGEAMEKDEWGRDELFGYASQVAAFTRKEGEVYAQLREENFRHHIAHPAAMCPQPFPMIVDATQEMMQKAQQGTMSIRELWFEYDVSTLCGGWVEFLIAALHEESGMQLQKSTEGDWQVLWLAYEPILQDTEISVSENTDRELEWVFEDNSGEGEEPLEGEVTDFIAFEEHGNAAVGWSVENATWISSSDWGRPMEGVDSIWGSG